MQPPIRTIQYLHSISCWNVCCLFGSSEQERIFVWLESKLLFIYALKDGSTKHIEYNCYHIFGIKALVNQFFPLLGSKYKRKYLFVTSLALWPLLRRYTTDWSCYTVFVVRFLHSFCVCLSLSFSRLRLSCVCVLVGRFIVMYSCAPPRRTRVHVFVRLAHSWLDHFSCRLHQCVFTSWMIHCIFSLGYALFSIFFHSPFVRIRPDSRIS